MSQDSLGYEKLFKNPAPRIKPPYNAILLMEYTPSSEYGQISRTSHLPGDIAVVFSRPTKGEPTYELTPGYALIEPIWQTMGLSAKIVSTPIMGATPPLRAELVIRGESIVLTGLENIYHAPWHSGREATLPYPVNLPFFITTTQGYENMRAWFLARKFKLLQLQIELNAPWRGNPEREVADLIEMQFDKSGRAQLMDIVSTEMHFRGGGLRGYIKAIGENPMRQGL